MEAARRLRGWAPLWMWLFWAAGALIIGAGWLKGGEPQPHFLVSTGLALEVWHGAERESVLLRFDDGASILDAAPSPDGARIAFVRLTPPPSSEEGDFGTDLYVVWRDGSEPRPIVRHSIFAEFIDTPVWLTSGNEVAYGIVTPLSDEIADKRIEVVDVTTGVRRRLVEDADQVAPMANGNLMVRRTDVRPGRAGEVPALYNVTSGRLEDLRGFNLSLVYMGSFALSPDGRQVAFGAADPEVRAPGRSPLRSTSAPIFTHPILQDVWLMDLDGSNLRRLADLAVHQPSLTWSQDGVFIYAMAPIGFWRIDARTGTAKKLGPGLPNGRIRLLPEG